MASVALTSTSQSLSLSEILLKLQSLGFCSGLESPAEPSDEKMDSLFHGILSVFLEEVSEKRVAHPLPARVADGLCVDLLGLFWVVRERSGHGSVTASQTWAAVSEALGLDAGLGSALKLVYMKYLDAFDRWVEKEFGEKLTGDVQEVKEGLSESVMEVNGSFISVSDRKKDRIPTPLLRSKDHFLTPVKSNERRSLLDDGGGCDECGADNGRDDDCVIIEPKAISGAFPALKRKWDALVGMLNWLVKVAKDPGDPSIRIFSSRRTKKNGNEFGEMFSQVFLARRAMFLHNVPGVKGGSSFLLERQKMHPSFYEDSSGPYTPLGGRLRSSQRINSINRLSRCGSSRTYTIHDGNWDKDMMVLDEYIYDKQKLKSSSLLPDVVCGVSFKNRQRVPLGPCCQAEVPDWPPMASSTLSDFDDLKSYNTLLWPLEEKNEITAIQDSVGKGRQDGCICVCPGSVDCVRFHIAENRFQLKCELGSAFHAMGFNRMGEEIALSWTEKEELRFKAVVHVNRPSLQKNFWDHLHLSFPLKGRQNLVSYYFNVFLLRHRSYQNRVTPNSINSDDEDTEFGFLSGPFSNEVLKMREPNSIFHGQNAVCVDLDSD